jgi:hypothetical protein
MGLGLREHHFAFGRALLGKLASVSIGRTDLGEVMEFCT